MNHHYLPQLNTSHESEQRQRQEQQQQQAQAQSNVNKIKSSKILKIKTDYFISLMKQQRQSQDSIRQLQQQIYNLKKRVRKCEKHIYKSKSKNKHYSHQPQTHKHNDHYLLPSYKDNKVCIIDANILSDTKTKKISNQNLYATFGYENNRNLQEYFPISRQAGKFTKFNDEEFYFQKQPLMKKNKKKKTCDYRTQNQKYKGHQVSRCSIYSNKSQQKFARLLQDLQIDYKNQRKHSKKINNSHHHRQSGNAIKNKSKHKTNKMEQPHNLYFIKN